MKKRINYLYYILLSLSFILSQKELNAETFSMDVIISGIMLKSANYDSGPNRIGEAQTGTIYRCYGTISTIALPADAEIDNATLTVVFSNTLTSYTMKIVTLSNDPSGNDYATNWTNIGGGTSLISNMTTSGTQTSSPADLKTIIQALVDSGTPVYFGFLSNHETTAGSENPITVSISVTYHKGTYSFTVKNSFDDGTVKVDNTIVNSGKVSKWNDGTYHALEVIDQYSTVKGYNYVWNTSGVTESISHWQIKKPNWSLPSNLSGGGTRAYSYLAWKADNGSTIIADMKKKI